MKLLAVVFTALALSPSVFAANGTNLIGISPQSTSMGGTGVAHFTGANDAFYKNPALLSALPAGAIDAEIDGTLIALNSSVSGVSNLKGPQFLPSLGGAYRVNEDITLGLGLITYGGSAFDRNGTATLFHVKNESSLIRLLPTIAYKLSPEFSVGVSPIFHIGSLSVNESASGGGVQSTRGGSTVMGFGMQAGVTYQPSKLWVFGLNYISPVASTYKAVMNVDLFGFVPDATLDDVKVTQPQEIALGAAYILDKWHFTSDLRFINWNGADGFKDFGWRNQWVAALGAEYLMDAWSFRAGYNYSNSPIASVTSELGDVQGNFQGHSVSAAALSLLNAAAFPAISEHHITFGAGYKITGSLVADLGFMFSPTSTLTRSGAAPLTYAAFGGGGAYSYLSQLSQWSITGGARYSF